MPQVIVTRQAVAGLARCREFLRAKNPLAAVRAGQAITRSFALLETEPEQGRPFSAHPEFRELLIEFGDSGYVALYRYERNEERVYILAFRHQKEAGF